MQKNVCYFSVCGSFWLTSQAFAQSGIETLVVTGERGASAAAVFQQLDVDELQPGSRADAAELLQGITGVQADSRSNYAQDTRVTLRGFGARAAFGVRGLDLHIDGIPLSMPDGQGQFSGVVLDGVSNVRVLTGPVAALYGNGAGGVINLTSAVPAKNLIAVSTAAEEDGLARHHFLGEFRDGELGARIQMSRLDAEGNRPHASAEREQLGAQVYYQLGNAVKAQYRFDKEDAPLLQDPLGLNQAQWQANPYQLNSSADFFNTRKHIEHQQHALSFRKEHGNQRWQFALWQGDRHIQQYLAQRGDAPANSGGVVDLNRNFKGANANYTWDLKFAQNASFTLGGEWSSMNDMRKGYVNNAGIMDDLRRNELDEADNRDAYALLQWHATENWEWLLGVRHSHVELSVDDYYVIPAKNADDSGDKKFSKVSGSLATRYPINSDFSVRAAIGNGFETPTLTEMAYTNGDKGFNHSLSAATNRQQEVGIDYTKKNISAALTGFMIGTQDELVVDQSINGRTTYINATETERKGVEFSGRYELNPQWNLRVAMNYLHAVYSQGQFENLQLPGVAKTNHYAQLNWVPLPNDWLKFSLGMTHRAQVAASDNNQIKAPSYTLYDISMSGKWSFVTQSLSADWWLKLNNLSNENYVGSVIVNQSNGRSFEPASGRNLAAGVKLVYEF